MAEAGLPMHEEIDGEIYRRRAANACESGHASVKSFWSVSDVASVGRWQERWRYKHEGHANPSMLGTEQPNGVELNNPGFKEAPLNLIARKQGDFNAVLCARFSVVTRSWGQRILHLGDNLSLTLAASKVSRWIASEHNVADKASRSRNLGGLNGMTLLRCATANSTSEELAGQERGAHQTRAAEFEPQTLPLECVQQRRAHRLEPNTVVAQWRAAQR
eukprot:6491824-Amphidinium_carterae.4